MRLYRANTTFYMGQIDEYSPEDDFQKIVCGEVIGDFENTTRMLIKETQVPMGLPDSALPYLDFVGVIPDPAIPCETPNLRFNVVPVGAQNGVNDTWSMPAGLSYAPNSLLVHLNGVLYDPSSITKVAPDYTDFTIAADILPDVAFSDVFTVSFAVASE